MNKRIGFKTVAVLLSFLQLTGCSTISGRHRDEQIVNFDSNVQGVEVICSGKRTHTPGGVSLRQSKDHSCVAQADGYEKKIFRIRSGVSRSGFKHSTDTNAKAWGWWTLGIGVVLGWIVDLFSGAMRDIKEKDYSIEMKPVGTTSTPKRVLDKTVDVGKAIVEVPRDVARQAASTVVDTTVRGTAEQMGVVEEESQQEKEEEREKEPKVV